MVVGVAIWVKVPVPVVFLDTRYSVAPAGAVHDSEICPSPAVGMTPVGAEGGTQAGVTWTWAELAEPQAPLLAVTT